VGLGRYGCLDISEIGFFMLVAMFTVLVKWIRYLKKECFDFLSLKIVKLCIQLVALI
jgi:hypothetical protein